MKIAEFAQLVESKDPSEEIWTTNSSVDEAVVATEMLKQGFNLERGQLFIETIDAVVLQLDGDGYPEILTVILVDLQDGYYPLIVSQTRHRDEWDCYVYADTTIERVFKIADNHMKSLQISKERLLRMAEQVNPGTKQLMKCDSCGFIESSTGLERVKNLEIRLDPGHEVPAGACSRCGALSYLTMEETT